MTVIRIAISLFIAVLVVAAVAGWTWTATHQPPAQAAASHLVLGASALAGVVGLFVIWRAPRPSAR